MGVYKNDTLTEQSIYGSSRLGLVNYASKTGYRSLGGKKYELTNHLGNVLAVVSDNIHLDQDSTWTSLIDTTDYYPFGLAMDGRSVQDSTYRYGFNGKEEDSNGEWGGQSHYDYGFRIYNPRIAKFLSVDPLAPDFPWNSPYAFSENRVIDGVDLEGLEYAQYQRLTKAEKSIIFKPTGIEILTAVRTGNIIDKLSKNKEIAEQKTIDQFKNSSSRLTGFHNDEADAFRHTLFNALNTQSLGEDLAKQLGDAHEAIDDPIKLKDQKNEIQMDLHNNAVGRGIAIDNPDASVDDLVSIIQGKRQSGELKVLMNPKDNKTSLIPSGGDVKNEEK